MKKPISLNHQQPQFGWTKNNPPQYKIQVTPGDIKDLQSGLAKDEFVKKIATQLVSKDDDVARFAVITGVKDIFKTDSAAREFHHHLTNQVMDKIKQDNPWFDTPAKQETGSKKGKLGKVVDAIMSYPAFIFRAAKRRSNYLETKEPVEKNNYGYFEKTRTMNGMKSVHFTHFDYDDGLLSLMYGPFKNIDGGFPKVSDIRQYVRDKNKKSVRRSVPFLTPVLKKTKEKILDNYTLELPIDAENDRPIFMALNRRDDYAGIAHGVSEITVKDDTQEAFRKLQYKEVTLEPNKLNTWC